MPGMQISPSRCTNPIRYGVKEQKVIISTSLLVAALLVHSNLRAKRIKFIKAVRAQKQVEQWERN